MPDSVGKKPAGRKGQGRHYRRFSGIFGNGDSSYQPLKNSARVKIGKIEVELLKSG
jgi:hypothetical protein